MRRLAFAAALAFALTPPALGSSPEELVAEGNQFLTGGDIDGAISRFGKAQSLRPNSPEVDLDLGLAHYRKGDHDRAAAYFMSAAGKGGGRLAAVAGFNLGNVRAGQGRFEDALDAYRASLEADPADEDARFNYELVERHLAELKEQEEKRKVAEEEFKKRLEELLKEVAEIVQRQAEAVAQTWAADAGAVGALPEEKDAETLKSLAQEQKPIPDELGSKLVRALVKSRELEVEALAESGLAKVERGLAARARKAAETAATLAAAIRPPQEEPPPQPTPQAGPEPGPELGTPEAEAPQENPFVAKLERAGGALAEGGKRLDRADAELRRPAPRAFRRAESHEAAGLWKFVQALGELAQPPGHGQESIPEELKEALKRMQELRARQALLLLDLWAKFPGSRGKVPGPDEQRAFWKGIRAGEAPDEEARLPMARFEIAVSGEKGEPQPPKELAERQAGLAREARDLSTELEAIAANAGGQSPVGALVPMLRSAAEAMDKAAVPLGAEPPGPRSAEPSAVLAFVRLSRAPTEMDALLADLGELIAEQIVRVFDTWESDGASRGNVPSDEDLEAASDEIERAAKGEAELSPELEAGLGRLASVTHAAGARVGQALAGEEAAKLQGEFAARAATLAGDMKGLAASGRQGEMNPAAPMLGAAAKDVEHAAGRMEAAVDSLRAIPTSFTTSEPDQARAVAALVRAFAKFAQGAAGSAGEEDQQQAEQKEQKEKGEGDETEQKKGQEGDEQEEKDSDEQDDERESESIEEQQAERLLDEAAQEEREVRRDIRKRRGTGTVEVRRDW